MAPIHRSIGDTGGRGSSPSRCSGLNTSLWGWLRFDRGERSESRLQCSCLVEEAEADGESGCVARAAVEAVTQSASHGKDVMRSGGEEGDRFKSSFACSWIECVRVECFHGDPIRRHSYAFSISRAALSMISMMRLRCSGVRLPVLMPS